MIASLCGKIQAKLPERIIVSVGNFGISVYVPGYLAEQATIGEEIFLHTHLIVREDLLALYGFTERQQLEMFELLLGVNGVGPRSALMVVTVLSPDVIRRAVLHEQPEVFARVPGIGKKTAQKILITLQDRIAREPQLGPVTEMGDVDTEVLAALTSLGYSVVEAQSAIQSIPKGEGKDVEARLRLALQYFTK